MVRSAGLVVGYYLLFITNSSYLHLTQQQHNKLCPTSIELEKVQIYDCICAWSFVVLWDGLITIAYIYVSLVKAYSVVFTSLPSLKHQ